MKKLPHNNSQNGFGLIEAVIILLVAAIIFVSALPHFIASRRLANFPKIQPQIVEALRDARREATAQRAAITFVYDDTAKKITVSGGSFGKPGAAENRTLNVAGGGLLLRDIAYGRAPNTTSAKLEDGTDATPLDGDKIEITFQSSGLIVDETDHSPDKALFFYSPKIPADSAFAVSVLGASGRIKVWQYDRKIDSYTEISPADL